MHGRRERGSEGVGCERSRICTDIPPTPPEGFKPKPPSLKYITFSNGSSLVQHLNLVSRMELGHLGQDATPVTSGSQWQTAASALRR